MAKNDLWQKLNSDVSIANVKALLTGQPIGPPDAVDTQAEEILAYATREAKMRGTRVEAVLAELGFSVPPGSAAPGPVTSRAPADPPAPLARAPEQKPDPRARARAEGQQAIAAHLPSLSATEVLGLLDQLQPESGFIERLACLYPEKGQVRPVPGVSLWESLLAQGVPAAAMAEVLRTEPSCPPPSIDGKSFREYLVQKQVLSPQAESKIGQKAEQDQMPFLHLALSEGYLTRAVLCDALAGFSGLARAAVPLRKPTKTALVSFPDEWIRYLRVVPVRRNGAALVVALPYVPPDRLQQQLEAIVGRKVQAQLATPEEVDSLRAQLLGQPVEEPQVPAAPPPRQPVAPVHPETLVSAPSAVSPLQTVHSETQRRPTPVPAAPMVPVTSTALEDSRSEARLRAMLPQVRYTSAVDAVDGLLRLALESRATDVHIEPADKGARVRFRIDGICHEVTRLDPGPYIEVVARIKILADLDVTERRRPQDGHIHTSILGREHDLRVATVPARGGEKVNLRIANTGKVAMCLDQLGLVSADLAVLRDVASLPFGMILATGPVGSGKTTTLYSCLSEVDRAERHVMSIEDPIEFTLEGANHVEVNYAIGFDFVQGLRALLRQDPDTILIGEIRDEETARIAVRASMTGLMVYSTLHANDATGAVTALRNYHIPSHLLASAIRGVVAQRLLRKVCENCRVPQPLGPEDAHLLGMTELPRGLSAYRGQGCTECLHTGYKGRTGVFEIFRVDETIRNFILEEASEREIRTYAISQGMRTLQQDGLQKIADGVTTIEEFHRVLRF